MSVKRSTFHRAVRRLIASPELPDVAKAVAGIIRICERQAPHADWAAVKRIDFAADVAKMHVWFDAMLIVQPPRTRLRGLWFGLCQQILPSGEITIGIQLMGTRSYDPADVNLDWVSSGSYFPKGYIPSDAMHRLFGIAHGTHAYGIEVKGVLGNDAEEPVGLAYVVLAARAALEGRSVADLPTDRRRIGVAAGWVEGDPFLIGELGKNGFVPAGRSS